MDILPRVKNNQFAFVSNRYVTGDTVDNLLGDILPTMKYLTHHDLIALRRVSFNISAAKKLGWPGIVLFKNTVGPYDRGIIARLEEIGVVSVSEPAPGRSRVMQVLMRDVVADNDREVRSTTYHGRVQLKVNGIKSPITYKQNILDQINHHSTGLNVTYLPTWSTKRVQLTTASLTYDRLYIDDTNTYGRFIAPFQTLSRIDRATMQIDGQPTCECDFSAMHPTLLYAQEQAVPPSDLYLIPGLPPKECREYIKLALLISINARDYDSSLVALTSRIPSRIDAAQLLQRIRTAHTKIAKHFWSNAGIRLMNTESNIAESVLVRCALMGIPVLGIHDGFICKRSDAVKMQEIMKSAFNQVTGYMGIVKTSVK